MRTWLSLLLGLALDILQFWNVYRTVRNKDFVFLARVRVSSPYFPVLDCTSYVFLARVRVSSQYFSVLDYISYSCARKRSWRSLWLGLAVDIFEFWNVYCTVHKKVFMFLARVRVSSRYLQCWIVYHTVAQERDRGFRCGWG